MARDCDSGADAVFGARSRPTRGMLLCAPGESVRGVRVRLLRPDWLTVTWRFGDRVARRVSRGARASLGPGTDR